MKYIINSSSFNSSTTTSLIDRLAEIVRDLLDYILEIIYI